MREAWRQIAEATHGTSRLRWVGIAFSALIVGAAATVLFHILGTIKLENITAALRSVRGDQIALAALFSAGSYLSLTAYDFFALRTIGRSGIPYRVAAMAGFASYSIGHNLGASTLTCGIVRYHVYSEHGLGVVDVAKIGFVTGLTFWLGNITVLGLCLSYDPAAASLLNQLPPALNRALGSGLLAACFFYLIWVATGLRIVGRNNWKVALPNGRLTLVQIAIGVFDLLCCASAMYVLMPDIPISIVTLTIVFVSAMLLGYASTAPGGIGVFDAAMLVALPQFAPESLIARLLLFRLICYIAPAMLALAMLGVRQIWLARRPLFDVR